jgi:hypothetical protein
LEKLSEIRKFLYVGKVLSAYIYILRNFCIGMIVGLMDQNLINAGVNDDVENVIAAECFLLNLFLLVCEH